MLLEATKQLEQPKPQSKERDFRAIQVADMTTFMARLLFKLTEASVKHANDYIDQQNELALALVRQEQDEEQGLVKPENRSQIDDEFYLRKMQKFQLTRENMLSF